MEAFKYLSIISVFLASMVLFHAYVKRHPEILDEDD